MDYTEQQLREHVKRLSRNAEGHKKLATLLGVSEFMVASFAGGSRPPSKRLLKVLGFEPKERLYARLNAKE